MQVGCRRRKGDEVVVLNSVSRRLIVVEEGSSSRRPHLEGRRRWTIRRAGSAAQLRKLCDVGRGGEPVRAEDGRERGKRTVAALLRVVPWISYLHLPPAHSAQTQATALLRPRPPHVAVDRFKTRVICR